MSINSNYLCIAFDNKANIGKESSSMSIELVVVNLVLVLLVLFGKNWVLFFYES